MSRIIRIVDFAEERNVDGATVGAYMKNHQMKYDRKTGLTDNQIKILSEKYPLPAAEVVVMDNESRDKLLESQAQLLKAQAEISHLKDEIIRLTEQTAKIALLEDMQSKQEQREQELTAEVQSKDVELIEARHEIERLRKRGLWQRIVNK